jgi:hypothetical protein
MLLQEPGRARVFAGKLTAIVGFTICAVAVGELASIALSFAMASSQDVDTSQWLTADGLAHAGEALARAAGYVLVSAVIAAVVGVLARSGPIGDGTSAGERYFPGLLLRALISPGSTSVGTGAALATLAVYSVIAAGVGAIALRRRDVTS